MRVRSPTSLSRSCNPITTLLLLAITAILLSTSGFAMIDDDKLYPDSLDRFSLIINDDLIPNPTPYEVVISAPAKKCPLPVSMWNQNDPGKAATDPTYHFMLNDAFFRQRGLETASIIPCYSRTWESRSAGFTYTPGIFFSKTRLVDFPAYGYPSPLTPADNDDPRASSPKLSTNAECDIDNVGEREANTPWALSPPTCSLQSKSKSKSKSSDKSDKTAGKIVCKKGSGSDGVHEPLQCHQTDPVSQPTQPQSSSPSAKAAKPNNCSMFMYVLRPFIANGPFENYDRWVTCYAQSPASTDIQTTATHNTFFAFDYVMWNTRQLYPTPAYYRDISFDYLPDVPPNGNVTEYATQDHSQQHQGQSDQQRSPQQQQQSSQPASPSQNQAAQPRSFKTKHKEERESAHNSTGETQQQWQHQNTSLHDNYLRALESDQRYANLRHQQQQTPQQPQPQHSNPGSHLPSFTPHPLQTITAPDPVPKSPSPRIDYLKITFARFPDSTFIDFQLAFGLATQSLLDESSFFSNNLMKWIQSYWSSSLRQNKPYASCGHRGARLLIRESGPQSRMVFTLALSPLHHVLGTLPEIATCTIPIPIQLVHNQLMQNTRRNFPQGWNNQQISVTLRLDEVQGGHVYTYHTTHEKARWNFLDPNWLPSSFPAQLSF